MHRSRLVVFSPYCATDSRNYSKNHSHSMEIMKSNKSGIASTMKTQKWTHSVDFSRLRIAILLLSGSRASGSVGAGRNVRIVRLFGHDRNGSSKSWMDGIGEIVGPGYHPGYQVGETIGFVFVGAGRSIRKVRSRGPAGKSKMIDRRIAEGAKTGDGGKGGIKLTDETRRASGDGMMGSVSDQSAHVTGVRNGRQSNKNKSIVGGLVHE